MSRPHGVLSAASAVLLLCVVGLFAASPVAARTILPSGRGTVWKYLDTGIEPAAAWRDVDFDDSSWKSGPAPLGYGEPRLGTEIRFGDAARKHVTTWLRREFTLPASAAPDALVILLSVDDGAVVYCNGEEVERVNLPARPVVGRDAGHASRRRYDRRLRAAAANPAVLVETRREERAGGGSSSGRPEEQRFVF
ncbi:MAG: hypothetical protein QM775_00950 [Pirellulales bacterium]